MSAAACAKVYSQETTFSDKKYDHCREVFSWTFGSSLGHLVRAQNFGEEGGVGAINGRAVWAGAVYGGDNKIAIDTTARGRDRGGRVGGVTRGEGRAAAAGTRKHFFYASSPTVFCFTQTCIRTTEGLVEDRLQWFQWFRALVLRCFGGLPFLVVF